MSYTEEEVWQLTPRKFKSQIEVHIDIQRQINGQPPTRKAAKPTHYIDQIPGW